MGLQAVLNIKGLGWEHDSITQKDKTDYGKLLLAFQNNITLFSR